MAEGGADDRKSGSRKSSSEALRDVEELWGCSDGSLAAYQHQTEPFSRPIKYQQNSTLDCVQSVAVRTVFIDNGLQLYFQANFEDDNLKKINAVCEKVGSTTLPEPATHKWHKNQACVARMPDDDTWYRASIMKFPEDLESDQDEFKVLFVDYGNCSIVPAVNMRSVVVCQSIHCLAIGPCCLDIKPIENDADISYRRGFNNLVWSDNAVDFADDHLRDQVVQASFRPRIFKAPIQVALTHEWIREASAQYTDNFAHFMIWSNQAKAFSKRLGDSEPSVMWERRPYRYSIPMDPKYFEATFLHSKQPDQVYIHHEGPCKNSEGKIFTSEENVRMQEQIQEEIDTCAPLNSLTINKPCLMMYENVWNRAMILNDTADHVSIELVDRGEQIQLKRYNDFSLAFFREVPAKFLEIPVRTVLCKIYNLKPAGSKWHENANTILTEVLSNTQRQRGNLICKVKGISSAENNNLPEIEIHAELTTDATGNTADSRPYSILVEQEMALPLDNIDIKAMQMYQMYIDIKDM